MWVEFDNILSVYLIFASELWLNIIFSKTFIKQVLFIFSQSSFLWLIFVIYCSNFFRVIFIINLNYLLLFPSISRIFSNSFKNQYVWIYAYLYFWIDINLILVIILLYEFINLFSCFKLSLHTISSCSFHLFFEISKFCLLFLNMFSWISTSPKKLQIPIPLIKKKGLCN